MERTMKPYTFYLHERRREGPSFQFVSCEDDEHARIQARDLFDTLPELIEVEIYDGRQSRFRVGRPHGETIERHAAAG
jgi:hypothetical protein